MNSLRRIGLAFIAASALAGVGSAVAATGAVRLGLLIGLGIGFLSGAMALAWVAQSAQKSTQAALLAVVTGFLVRMVMVALALIVTRAAGGEPLACAAGFFLLYAVGQGLEIALVLGQQRAQAQERRA